MKPLFLALLLTFPALAKIDTSCTEKALRHAPITVEGKYTLKQIQCVGKYAHGLVSLLTAPGAGSASVILVKSTKGWTEIVAPGAGDDDYERCLTATVPEPVCYKFFEKECAAYPACLAAQSMKKKGSP